MIKAVLFDFDGVITTDATGSESICKYISQQTGLNYEFFLKEYRQYNKELLYGETTHEDIWDNLCRKVGMTIDINVLYDSFINTPIDNEMISLASKLKDNKYKIGMITDNKKDRIDKIVTYHNWSKLFDVIIVSASIGSGKSNQVIFNRTLDNLMLISNECVFIDNNDKNLVVPADIGMRTIYFEHNERDVGKLIKELNGMGILI